MEDIVKKIKNGDALVNVTGDGFQEIMEKSSKVVHLIEEIAAASQEQAQGIEQINKAMAEMNNTTQHNAAAAEQLASVMAIFRTNGNGSKTPVALQESNSVPLSISCKAKKVPRSGEAGLLEREIPESRGIEAF
jgi:methyl-accepting chemotaxis protein